MAYQSARVASVTVRDVRFPTSLEKHGYTDAVHPSPDFSCAYVIIKTDCLATEGHGHTFTEGRGTQIVCCAIEALGKLIQDKKLSEIFDDFGTFWQSLVSEDQLRWLGPEKGITHLATAAVINALWDMWAKLEEKPLWKLLVDMSNRIFHGLDEWAGKSQPEWADALTKTEALEILQKMQTGKKQREEELLLKGFPAYTMSCGWLGFPDEKIRQAATKALSEGWTRFKMKVGGDVEDDIRRANIFRKTIGYDCQLMVDANQKWEVQEAIEWMTKLKEYKLLWIEEPINPDDIAGHIAIAEALNPLGIGVATGEVCMNRVMFKQFLKSKAMQYCQIDACRLGGVNECLAVILMAAKYGVPVCPHGGGVALNELIQHLSMFDFVCVSGSFENRMIEYADHLNEHLIAPARTREGLYIPPQAPGYLVGIKEQSLASYSYPYGAVWQKLFEDGLFEQEYN